MNDLNSIPTIDLNEVVRVVTPNGYYDAQVLLTFADGSRNLAFTENGVVRIIRVAPKTNLVHLSN
jgi:hypothetical protein